MSITSTFRDQRLLELSDLSDYSVVQRNGQRVYGGPPPKWTGPPPEKGSEVFVGKVPRNCNEVDLVPIFGQVYMSTHRTLDQFQLN